MKKEEGGWDWGRKAEQRTQYHLLPLESLLFVSRQAVSRHVGAMRSFPENGRWQNEDGKITTE